MPIIERPFDHSWQLSNGINALNVMCLELAHFGNDNFLQFHVAKLRGTNHVSVTYQFPATFQGNCTRPDSDAKMSHKHQQLLCNQRTWLHHEAPSHCLA